MGETRGTTARAREREGDHRFGYGAQCVLAGVVIAVLMMAVVLSPVPVL
ncbi:hypothetical protein LQ327_28295 [Actinomycetospora endophytica]|uniref:Uncharacterized protein n=1 Tax=Actinomycetospora endophytica TaxID=2291215 RepID=A0ABS8PG93_9PSEU|nr:hypothetical protein [Actinomycetospora endophytica]MCD2197279.1 hypothetical protein [Actinomycetospora endophytica]